MLSRNGLWGALSGVTVWAALVAGAGSSLAAQETGWLVKVEDVVAAPAERHQVEQLVDAGVIETDGFTHVVLCLGGELKSRPTKGGKIGVVLVPDMFPFDKVLQNQGRFVFPIEVTAEVVADGHQELFESNQERAVIAFPRYRAYVYNTTDAVAGVWIYAYRTR